MVYCKRTSKNTSDIIPYHTPPHYLLLVSLDFPTTSLCHLLLRRLTYVLRLLSRYLKPIGLKAEDSKSVSIPFLHGSGATGVQPVVTHHRKVFRYSVFQPIRATPWRAAWAVSDHRQFP